MFTLPLRSQFMAFITVLALPIQGGLAQGGTTPVVPTVRYIAQHGNDLTGDGSLSNPYRTLTQTVQQSSIGDIDVLVLLPGIYDEVGGEVFPIAIPDGLSLQGTNALNTQIRGTPGRSTPLGLEITAPVQDTESHRDSFINGLVIADFVTGVRLQGEGYAFPSFSNCVFSICITAMEVIGYHCPQLVNCTFESNSVALDVDQNFCDFPILNSLFTANLLNTTLLGDGSFLANIEGSAYVDDDQFGSSPQVALPPMTGVGFVAPGFADFRLDITDVEARSLIDQGLTIAQSSLEFRRFNEAGVDVHAYDMEGFGNDRSTGAGIDIGADEVGELIVLGYESRSTTYLSNSAAINAGMQIYRGDAVTDGDTVFGLLYGTFRATPGYTESFSYSTNQAPSGQLTVDLDGVLGVRGLGTMSPLETVAGSICLQLPATDIIPFQVASGAGTVPAFVPGLSNGMGGLLPGMINLQAVTFVVGTGLKWSNLQTYVIQ